jgi:ubiquitin-conjugating enzyme E2 S
MYAFSHLFISPRTNFDFSLDFSTKGMFTTKIFHPNVSPAGDICVSTLKKDWKPAYGITHILTVIKCLLIYPNPESALDEEAGKMLLDDYEGYCKRARLMTSIHATRVRLRHPAQFLFLVD